MSLPRGLVLLVVVGLALGPAAGTAEAQVFKPRIGKAAAPAPAGKAPAPAAVAAKKPTAVAATPARKPARVAPTRRTAGPAKKRPAKGDDDPVVIDDDDDTDVKITDD